MIIELNTEIKSCGLTLFTLIEIKQGGISLINFIINEFLSLAVEMKYRQWWSDHVAVCRP